jgi:antitoxin component YwqK of YwqJK toxin-antitoxin module
MVLLLPALALGETMDDLVNRDGLYYKNFTDVPFTGKIVDYHPNGQLRKKETHKDGKKDGLWVFYGENGQLLSKLTVGQDGKIIVED